VSFRPRSAVNVTAVAVVGLLGFTACNSTPSDRRVVLDMIESLDQPAAADECMNEVVGDYSNDSIEQMAEQNADLAFDNPDFVASGTEQYQEFVARLTACAETGASVTTELPDSTDVTASTDATES